MGSPKTERGRNEYLETQHKVTLTKPFYIGIYEVTQRLGTGHGEQSQRRHALAGYRHAPGTVTDLERDNLVCRSNQGARWLCDLRLAYGSAMGICLSGRNNGPACRAGCQNGLVLV
jgi:hypothetical protein